LLVGHSQGSFILTRLIAEEIKTKPIASRMVSAIIPGATVPVAKGKYGGRAFQHLRLFHSATDSGA